MMEKWEPRNCCSLRGWDMMEKMGAQELLQFKRFGHNDGLRGSQT